MFVVETSRTKGAIKAAVLMAVIIALLTASVFPYVLFTMHFYVKPSPPIPRGFRIFGFPRPHQD
jgi:hypothetical protein